MNNRFENVKKNEHGVVFEAVYHDHYPITIGDWREEFDVESEHCSLSVVFKLDENGYGESAEVYFSTDENSYRVHDNLDGSCFMADLINIEGRLQRSWLPQLRCYMPYNDRVLLEDCIYAAYQFFAEFDPEETLNDKRVDVYREHLLSKCLYLY